MWARYPIIIGKQASLETGLSSRSVRRPLAPKPSVRQPTNHGAELIIDAKEPIRLKLLS